MARLLSIILYSNEYWQFRFLFSKTFFWDKYYPSLAFCVRTVKYLTQLLYLDLIKYSHRQFYSYFGHRCPHPKVLVEQIMSETFVRFLFSGNPSQRLGKNGFVSGEIFKRPQAFAAKRRSHLYTLLGKVIKILTLLKYLFRLLDRYRFKNVTEESV